MPDVELRPQIYKDPRPKEYFDPFHELVRSRPPESKVYETVRVFTELNALLVYRARAIGTAVVEVAVEHEIEPPTMVLPLSG